MGTSMTFVAVLTLSCAACDTTNREFRRALNAIKVKSWGFRKNPLSAARNWVDAKCCGLTHDKEETIKNSCFGSAEPTCVETGKKKDGVAFNAKGTYIKDVTCCDKPGITRMAVANGGWLASAIACVVVSLNAHSFGAVSVVLCITAVLFLFVAWRQLAHTGAFSKLT